MTETLTPAMTSFEIKPIEKIPIGIPVGSDGVDYDSRTPAYPHQPLVIGERSDASLKDMESILKNVPSRIYRLRAEGGQAIVDINSRLEPLHQQILDTVSFGFALPDSSILSPHHREHEISIMGRGPNSNRYKAMGWHGDWYYEYGSIISSWIPGFTTKFINSSRVQEVYGDNEGLKGHNGASSSTFEEALAGFEWSAGPGDAVYMTHKTLHSRLALPDFRPTVAHDYVPGVSHEKLVGLLARQATPVENPQ